MKSEFKQAYEFEFSTSWNIYFIFHVFLLKKKIKKNQTQSTTIALNDINIESDEKYIVDKFDNNRYFEAETISNRKKTDAEIYYLIDWKSYEKYNRTWKLYEHVIYLRIMLKRFHENWSNKSDDRDLTSSMRDRKKIARKKFFNIKQITLSKQIRKQSFRRTKIFRLISEIDAMFNKFFMKF